MKRTAITFAVIGLAGLLAACSQKTTETAATPEAAPAAPATAPAADMAGMPAAATAQAKTAKGTGTVTAVSADSITVDHAPIPEANWPAMNMAFKASPDVAKTVKAGDKVAFDLKLEGGGGEITAISKQ